MFFLFIPRLKFNPYPIVALLTPRDHNLNKLEFTLPKNAWLHTSIS